MKLGFNALDVAELGVAHAMTVDPFTGGASLSIPIPVTACRNGTVPSLAFMHQSGASNSPYGAGLGLSGLPAIALDTAGSIPRHDGADPLTFGGEDIVPALRSVNGALVPVVHQIGEDEIQEFRPRRSGAGVRIERWTNRASRRVHWRTRDRSDTVAVYGRREDGSSRVADPLAPEHVAVWLPESWCSATGELIEVEYAAETSAGVDYRDSFEHARLHAPLTQRYVKRVRWGNTVPALDGVVPAVFGFELVFDYGDHGEASIDPDRAWPVRSDPFSSFRCGFEIRTYRLCRRVLRFHRVPDLAMTPVLVGSLALEHDFAIGAARLRRVVQTGYRPGSTPHALPALTLDYGIDSTERAFVAASRETEENLPIGLGGRWSHLVDLHGDGLPGILIEGERAWHYKPNQGNGRFGPLELVAERPATRRGAFGFGDPDADGNTDLVLLSGRQAGSWELERDRQHWSSFEPFERTPHVEGLGRHSRWIDLNGDGRADLVVIRQDVLVWYPSRGDRDFGDPIEIAVPTDLRAAPMLTGAASELHFVDIDGDGMVDLVRVSPGGIEYWPHLGHGRFGDRIVVDAPANLGGAGGELEPRRVRFADLRGSGLPDLVYLGSGELRVYRNANGNRFVEAAPIRGLPFIDNLASAQILNFLGDGRPCLVWSNGLPGTASSLHYLPLAEERRPSRITRVANGLGREIALAHRSSAVDYFRDQDAGEPWLTRLPTHGTVVGEQRTLDRIGGTETIERYAYHDGFFDSAAREMRGFLRVDVLEGAADPASDAPHAAPRWTRTWYHGGADPWTTRGRAGEYPGNLPRAQRADVIADGLLSGEELRDGWISLAGSVVRREIYAATLDAAAPLGARPALHPLQIEEWGLRVVRRQAAVPGDEPTAVWSTIAREHVVVVLEGAPADPRTTRTLMLEVDDHDAVLRAAEIAHARTGPASAPGQATTQITISEQRVRHEVSATRHQIGIPIEVRSLAVEGLTIEQLGTPALEQALAGARLLDHERHYYWDDAGGAMLPLGEVGRQALPHHSEEACFAPSFIADAGLEVAPGDLEAAGYVLAEGLYWRRGVIQHHGAFGVVDATERSDGAVFRRTWDAHRLAAIAFEDPVGNVTTADIDYLRFAPWRITDPNGTVQEVEYDAHGVIVRSTNTAQVDGLPYGNEPLPQPAPPRPTALELLAAPESRLGNLANIVAYDLDAYDRDGSPPLIVSAAREQHVHDPRREGSAGTTVRVDVAYLDGMGRAIQSKTRVEPGDRWLASGHVQFDTAGHPARTFEPFFSTTAAYESPLLTGTSTLALHDALGRLVEEHQADGTLHRVALAAWSVTRFDANDTVDEGTWALTRAGLPADHPERRALEHARSHAGTSVVTHLDPAGEEIARFAPGGATSEDQTVETTRDPDGEEIALTDARGLVAIRWMRDLTGRIFRQDSIDAGVSRTLHDAFDRVVTTWDARGVRTEMRHDRLDRLLTVDVSGTGLAHRVEERVYGDALPPDEARRRNLLGCIARIRDEAGILEVQQAEPFHAVALRSTRQLRTSFDTLPDWRGEVGLEAELFTTEVVVDVAGRPVREHQPDGIIRRIDYLASGSARRITIASDDGALAETTVLEETTSDPYGHWIGRRLGNGADLARRYDPNSRRLAQQTVRTGPRTLQNLRYTYDPTGSIVSIVDEVQEPSTQGPILMGLAVSSRRDFAYDAHHRLIRATGRVHQGYLAANDFTEAGTSHLHPNNGAAVERYTRTYDYDRGNNLTRVRHTGPTINTTTELPVSATSNRSDGELDSAGNRLSLPHLRRLEWSWRGRLARAVIIDRAGAGPDDAEHYTYGWEGLRVRRVTQRVVAGEVELTDKIYLGGAERLRVRRGDNVLVERWTTRVAADGDEIATIDREAGETQMTYVIADHQRSPSLELDATGALVRYEEQFPYGGSAFMAAPDVGAAARKTRRYMAKERDAATGLIDFGHRMYAPWLGRWLSPDPIGPADDLNLYRFVLGDPIGNVDEDGLETKAGKGEVTAARVPMPEIPPPKEAPAAGNIWGWNPDTAAWEQHTMGEWVGIAKSLGFDLGSIYAGGDENKAWREVAPFLEASQKLAEAIRQDTSPSPWDRINAGDPNTASNAADAAKRPGGPGQPSATSAGGGGAQTPGTGSGAQASGSPAGGAGGAPGSTKPAGSGTGSGTSTGAGTSTGGTTADGGTPGSKGTSSPQSGAATSTGAPKGAVGSKGSSSGTAKHSDGGAAPRGEAQGTSRGVEGGVDQPGSAGTQIGDGANAVATSAPERSSTYGASTGTDPDGVWDGTRADTGVTLRNPEAADGTGFTRRTRPEEKLSTGEDLARQIAMTSAILNADVSQSDSGSNFGVADGGNPHGIQSPWASAAASFVIFSLGGKGKILKSIKKLQRKVALKYLREARRIARSKEFKDAIQWVTTGNEFGKLSKETKGLVRQHSRLLWQGTHGTWLPKWIQVHHRIPLEYAHLSGKNPNAIENLWAFTDKAHGREHGLLRLASKEGGPMYVDPMATNKKKSITHDTVVRSVTFVEASHHANGIRPIKLK